MAWWWYKAVRAYQKVIMKSWWKSWGCKKERAAIQAALSFLCFF
jgi:hypothetical protein